MGTETFVEQKCLRQQFDQAALAVRHYRDHVVGFAVAENADQRRGSHGGQDHICGPAYIEPAGEDRRRAP